MVLITEAIHEVFPPAGARALAVVPMVAVSMAVADIIANRIYQPVELMGNSKMEKEYHVAQDFDFCST